MEADTFSMKASLFEKERLLTVKITKEWVFMSKQYLFVANWKMHLPFNQTIEFTTSHYDKLIKLAEETKHKIILCPSFENLYPIIQMFKSTPIKIGAQNCSSHTSGSFTGQVAPQSLQELGCSYCIVGHSETKICDQLCGDNALCETPETVAQKCIHLLDYDITPILCVGETQEEKDANKTLDVIKSQLEPLFKLICNKTVVHTYLSPWIAYEPVWARGNDQTASPEHLDMVLTWLQEYIAKECRAIKWKFMYGGSVSGEKIAKLKKLNKIDGFMIGKSSLNFQKFEKIVQYSE